MVTNYTTCLILGHFRMQCNTLFMIRVMDWKVGAEDLKLIRFGFYAREVWYTHVNGNEMCYEAWVQTISVTRNSKYFGSCGVSQHSAYGFGLFGCFLRWKSFEQREQKEQCLLSICTVCQQIWFQINMNIRPRVGGVSFHFLVWSHSGSYRITHLSIFYHKIIF